MSTGVVMAVGDVGLVTQVEEGVVVLILGDSTVTVLTTIFEILHIQVLLVITLPRIGDLMIGGSHTVLIESKSQDGLHPPVTRIIKIMIMLLVNIISFLPHLRLLWSQRK
jgi:hypothetical protein